MVHPLRFLLSPADLSSSSPRAPIRLCVDGIPLSGRGGPAGSSTPYRDLLAINAEEDSILGDMPARQRERQRKKALGEMLQSLPQPENEYRAVVPELEGETTFFFF